MCGGGDNMTAAEKEKQRQAKARSREIERNMQDDNTTEQQINKLLLLGAGESGKSTLFKQMIEIYGAGFPDSERATYAAIIYNNVISSMQDLCKAAPEHGGPIHAKDAFQLVTALKGNEEVDMVLAGHLKKLWADPGIQVAYKNRSKFQLTDSASYFFDRLDQIGADNYLPEKDHVLRSRVRTTGIVENDFCIEGNNFKMYDVGGQRNERKKWIHCFENVTAVLFVGVLSEYDLVLYEDENTNRMVETLMLFDEIINSRWFRETAMILFLNKRDMFQDKITETDENGNLLHPLTDCPVFEPKLGFTDEINNYETGCQVILEAFQSKNRDPEKQIYHHLTCATDTSNIAHVFDAVKDIIIRRSLGEAGLV